MIVMDAKIGETVTVSDGVKPVAEISSSRPRKPALDERLKDLERSGELVPSAVPRQTLGPVERRPAALASFLAERGE